MQNNGYIKLYRKFVYWGWYKNSVVKDLFLHLLCTAAYQEFEWQGEIYPAGTLITTVKDLSENLGFTTQQIRTAIQKLCSSGEISKKSTNNFSIINVLNWGIYQGCESDEQQTDNKRITNEQQTDNKRITNATLYNKEYKNIRNKEIKEEVVEEEKNGGGNFPKLEAFGGLGQGVVYLSEEQAEKLLDLLGVDMFDEYVGRLADYIIKNDAKVHNHYETILKWYREDASA